ncbi:metal-dependent hydrolase [bacterium]|jgi:L-ascorbate metabolism protein UlaG (beta-lactamase superfamily)|nr:metal-dependent hydrolase [bacterium]
MLKNYFFKRTAFSLFACVLLSFNLGVSAQSGSVVPGKVELLWLGQAGWRIKTPTGKQIVIDPWITGGPKAPQQFKNDLSALGPVDLLLVTHAHVDHIGDAPTLAKLHNTVLYGPADMVTPLITLGIIPANLGHRFNKSGSVRPLPGIKVTAVQAEHSSLLVWNNPATSKNEAHPAGEAVGFIIELENGFKIWHMGDTGLFSDMKFISERYKPDLVLIPIGGNFTMDPDDAAYALRTWVKPKMAIPMHYNSNPLTKGTFAEFQAAMKGSPIKIIQVVEGQIISF